MRSFWLTLVLVTLSACAPQAVKETNMADGAHSPVPELGSDNPFAAPSSLPFEAPPFDRIRTEHYAPAFEAGMRAHLAEVRAIADATEAPSFANTIVALERSGSLLTRVSKVFFNLTESNTNPELQRLQAEYAPKLAAHRDAILLDERLWQRVRAVYEQRERLGLEAEALRLVERYHALFVRAGAALPEAKKARLKELNAEQARLQTEFQNHLLKATEAAAVVVEDRAELGGLSEAAIAQAAEAAKAKGLDGKYLLTLTNTTRQPVLVELDNRALRQRVLEASMQRGTLAPHDNRPLVARLAALRAETAALLGYPNWAAYVLDDQMAKTPEAAQKLLTDMLPAVLRRVRNEASALQQRIDAEGSAFALAAWDWEYYAERERKARYDVDEQELRAYFEFERVLRDGAFHTFERLYGIRFRERKDLPVYHPDVRVFDVLDADGSPIGLFYGDWFAREGKRGGAWMDSFVDQNGLTGQKPVVVNVMNIQKGAAGQPTLLPYDDVKTLFHELGHALHGLFSNTRYPLLSGTNVPRDFVEFPSQFEEDWSLEPSVLANYAKHHATGAPMPSELVQKMLAARRFNQGFDTLEYLAAALLDLEWHALSVAQAQIDDVLAFEAAALARHGVDLAPVPPRYRSTYFAHVWPGGYSAGYYAYLWSEILAADAFAEVARRGGLTRANGDAYRAGILSRGGTAEPMALYVAWRGGEPGVEALLTRRGLR